MNIIETYYLNNDYDTLNCDYSMYSVNNNIYVGINNQNEICVLLKSKTPNADSLSQRTNLISLETNAKVGYFHDNTRETGTFHIFKCFSKDRHDQEIFLKLCDAYFSDKEISQQDICETFMILTSFFSYKKSFSFEELQGIYAELFTILYFKEKFDFAKCWQSKDKLKFDFSISSKTKLEVKSTLKEDRIHYFSHDQLATKMLNIFILSFKLRFDDSGLKLKELIKECLPLLKNYPDKQQRILKILYECSENELNQHKYSKEYTIENMHFYSANKVPHLSDVEGVSHARYDSNFENIDYMNNQDFFELLEKLV